MAEFFRTRLLSFRYAFAGWRYVLCTQQNAWVHTFFTILVVALGFWLRLSAHDWVLIVLAIGMVWMTETVNTALEAIVDLVSPQRQRLARIGKDVGAAAVLMAVLCSAIIGFLILGPPLWQRLGILFARP